MREILFKDVMPNNLRKKDTVLREVFEKDGVTAKTERRCFYFIKDILHMDDASDLQKWLDSRNTPSESNKRHFHIIKEHSDVHGQDRVGCKITGVFYAVFNNTVYSIAYLHSFKVSFMKATLTN